MQLTYITYETFGVEGKTFSKKLYTSPDKHSGVTMTRRAENLHRRHILQLHYGNYIERCIYVPL